MLSCIKIKDLHQDEPRHEWTNYDDSSIEQAASYKYLDHEMTLWRDNQTREITRRISSGWVYSDRLRYTFKNKISNWLKSKAFGVYVLLAITYEAEILTFT